MKPRRSSTRRVWKPAPSDHRLVHAGIADGYEDALELAKDTHVSRKRLVEFLTEAIRQTSACAQRNCPVMTRLKETADKPRPRKQKK
jgi:aminoglycoside phosphotransferase